jgi:hypothetical protein
MHFAETVAVNRGLPMAVFSTVAEAEKWLQNKAADSVPPPTPVAHPQEEE